MGRWIFHAVACSAVLICVTAQSQSILSDFSPGASPFADLGFGQGTATFNNDGTETFFEPPPFPLILQLSLPSLTDLSDGGKYNAIAITGRREADNTRNSQLALSFTALDGVRGQYFTLRFSDFSQGSFSTVIIPFESFKPGPQVRGDGKPTELDFTRVARISINELSSDLTTMHFTFDRLEAISIPEPTTKALLALGTVFLLFARPFKA